MSRSAAPATKSPTRTSPNTAPATQNECHHWSASHMKRHFQCVKQVKSPCNLTKYCACHAKWMSSLICVTYETSFPMRGASKVTLQHHQILRLPRKMNVITDLRHIWNVISNAWSKYSTLQHHQILRLPRKMHVIPDLRHIWNVIYTTFRVPAISQNVTKCCACHEKSPGNLSKYCACHTKWTMNCDFTELWLY